MFNLRLCGFSLGFPGLAPAVHKNACEAKLGTLNWLYVVGCVSLYMVLR